MEKEIIIGIDVSKDKLDVCVLGSPDGPALEERTIGNTEGAIGAYLGHAAARYGDLMVCLEHTGHYGLLLCSMLERSGVAYCVVPAMEIRKSRGIVRGKSDRADAYTIACYALRFRDRLSPSRLPGADLLLAGGLLSLREHYVRIGTGLRNALKAYAVAGGVVDNGIVTESLEAQLANIRSEIARVEARMRELLEGSPETGKNFALLNTVKGIGPVTAAAMILTTRNFGAIRDGRKYNSYAGLAPFPHQSGKMDKGNRVSHMANKRIKTLLHNGACSAANHDPELRTYYKRKLAEGKNKMSILNAVACKLVYRAFAVIKRQTPYVNLYQHNVA